MKQQTTENQKHESSTKSSLENVKYRKRRHFKDDFKRYVLQQIEVGAFNIKKVIDPKSGREIPELLIQRWRDQFRTEGFQSIQLRAKYDVRADSISIGEAISMIGKLTIENEKLAELCKQLSN